MPRKKKIDTKALIEAVESGTPRKDIMAQFGFNNPNQVTAYYLDALVELGRAKAIVGRQLKDTSSKKVIPIKVNQRGSLVIPRERVTEFGYNIGDTFSISKTKAGDGISLKAQKE
jgi:hypothetical protein